MPYQAEDFLVPYLFRTDSDRDDDYTFQQYEKGRKIGEHGVNTIHISVTNSWSASGKNISIIAYERLGYHRSTDRLLQGFLDSGLPIVIHRLINGKVKSFNLN